MAKKAARQEAAQKKAAKQKKILILLGLLLVGAVVFAVITLSKGSGGSTPAAATSAGDTTPTGSISAGTPAAEITAGVTMPTDGSLRSLLGLGRNDPFHDGEPGQSSSSGSTSSCGCSGSQSDTHCRYAAASNASGNDAVAVVECKKGNGKWALGGTRPLAGGVISLNGTKLAVALGTEFGHAPGLSGVALFRLVKVTAKTAVIGVVGTQQRFTLHVRQPLTLEQDGGWTYTLILEPVGSPLR